MTTSTVIGQSANESTGRELHREFVGMLFALAIAEVAVEASIVANSSVAASAALPSYAHLALAAAVITTSWVGWGWSKHSLSNVRHVFTGDFVELCVDLWLVTVYFLIVKGVELPVATADGRMTVIASVSNESLWVMVVFISYMLWDLLTKRLSRDSEGRLTILERGWASALCAALAVVSYAVLSGESPIGLRVVLADMGLLFLVILFRIMKLENLHKLSSKHWCWIGALAVLWAICLNGSR